MSILLAYLVKVSICNYYISNKYQILLKISFQKSNSLQCIWSDILTGKLETFTKICNECWCGGTNRKHIEAGISLNDCKKRCLSDANCKGIEYWSGSSGTSCNECFDPRSTSFYTKETVLGFPPSVYERGKRY